MRLVVRVDSNQTELWANGKVSFCLCACTCETLVFKVLIDVGICLVQMMLLCLWTIRFRLEVIM